MNRSYVSDTMAVVLRLEKRKLSNDVKKIFFEAESNKSKLIIPAMVLAEIGYLSEKNKIDISIQDVRNYCDTHPAVNIEPLTLEIVFKSFEIDDVPELHDRIIAGTAFAMNLRLITNDPVIRASKFLESIW